MLKIAVDIDNVVLDLTQRFITLYNQRFGKKEDKNNWRCWDYHRDLGLTDEYAYAMYHEIQMDVKLLDATENNIEKYLFLMKKAWKVDVVTARSPATLEVLVRKLEELGIVRGRHYDDIVLVPTFPNNAKVKLDYDIYIDDNPNLATSLGNLPDKHILLYDQPWNRLIQNSFNVVRIHSWKEAIDAIKTISLQRSSQSKVMANGS